MAETSPGATGRDPDVHVSRAEQVRDLETLLQYAYERHGRSISQKVLQRLKKVGRPEDRHFELAKELGRDDSLLAVPPALLAAATASSVPDGIRAFVQRLVARASVPAHPALDENRCPAVLLVLEGESERLGEAVNQIRSLDEETLSLAGIEAKERQQFEENAIRTLVLYVGQREQWDPLRAATELDAHIWSLRIPTEADPLVLLVGRDGESALAVLMATWRQHATEMQQRTDQALAESERSAELERRVAADANARAGAAQEAAHAAQLRFERADAQREQALEELRQAKATHDDQRALANYDYERLRSRTMRQMTAQRKLIAEASEVLQNNPELTEVITDRLDAVLRAIEKELDHLSNGGSEQ